MKRIRLCDPLRLTAAILALAVLWTFMTAAVVPNENRSGRSVQTFTLEPEPGVTVTLSGLLPAGGTATAVNAETTEEDVIHAYDITIYDGNGAEFQPDEASPLRVTFSSDRIAEAVADGSELEAAHITDNGVKEDIELVSSENGEAVFMAESFSIYQIYAHDGDDNNETPRATYYFLDNEYQKLRAILTAGTTACTLPRCTCLTASPWIFCPGTSR